MFFFFQAEDGIRDLVRSRGLGDVYKRQVRDRRAVELRGRRPGVQDRTRLPEGAHDGMVLGLSLIHI